jgi:biopolymer transport protein ExbB/TolQ
MGVMNTFIAMGEPGSRGLAAISAGLAEALITTALGLSIAIPPLWLYKYATTRRAGIG